MNLLPGITVLGQCPHCSRFVEGIRQYFTLPKHSTEEGKECSYFGFSCDKVQYRIDSQEQALFVSQVILEDTATCLSGRERHSLICGDGRDCQIERSRRAKALARYCLDMLKVNA